MFGILFLASFASAGLLVDENSFIINKTVNEDYSLVFELQNTEDFSFFNISFEDNDFIEMDEIDELPANSNISVSATITTNLDVDENIKIKGYYLSDLGESSDTYNINIDYNNGIDNCDLQLIQGDTIVWHNLASTAIDLMYADGELMTTIDGGSNSSRYFNTPITFNYYASYFGLAFTDICTVNVLGSSGYINNPNFDAAINLKVSQEYEPTTISATFLETNYTMDFFKSQDGLLSIKNTGDKIAKNIMLSGDWFSFSDNNFDIDPGYSKTISYVISPTKAFTTNDTDKTYYINVSISGNFEEVSQQFSIFIKYADIDNNSYSAGTDIISILSKYCEEHPEADFCNSAKKIVYVNKTDDNLFNVTFQQDQIKRLFASWFGFMDSMSADINFLKDRIDTIENKTSNVSTSQSLLIEKYNEAISKEDKDVEVITVIILFAIAIAVAVILLSLIHI